MVEFRRTPIFPKSTAPAFLDWTGDGYETLREAAPEQLNKLIQSLVKTKLWALGDTNPQPVAENAPAAHSASPSPIQPTYLIGHGATDAKSTERIPFKEFAEPGCFTAGGIEAEGRLDRHVRYRYPREEQATRPGFH